MMLDFEKSEKVYQNHLEGQVYKKFFLPKMCVDMKLGYKLKKSNNFFSTSGTFRPLTKLPVIWKGYFFL
jgi:hypothetical protein